MNHKIYHKRKRNVGTIAQVGTISEYLSLSEGGFGQKLAKLTLCRMELVQFWAKWALSGVDLGNNCKHDRQLSKVGTIQGWNWANIWQSWHYPKVDLGQDLAKLALSEGESGPKSGKAGTIVHVDIIQGLGPKVVNLRNCRHFQGWIWTSRPPSLPVLQRKFKHRYCIYIYIKCICI